MKPIALLLATSLATALPAFADKKNAAMSANIQTYFDGEEQEGVAWMTIGSAGLTGGAAALSQPGNFVKGFAGMTIGFGAVHTLIGVYLLSYTPSRVAALRAEFDADPRALATREARRMDGVIRTFKFLTVAEIALIAGSLVMIGVGAGVNADYAIGAGTGLAIEALLTLACDLFAWRRARVYRAHLSAFLGG